MTCVGWVMCEGIEEHYQKNSGGGGGGAGGQAECSHGNKDMQL